LAATKENFPQFAEICVDILKKSDHKPKFPAHLFYYAVVSTQNTHKTKKDYGIILIEDKEYKIEKDI